MPVENQMTVYVPSPITFNIQVFGAVDKPGDVVMHEGDRLVMAIARAGNSPNVSSDLNHIVLRRPQADGSMASQTINLYQVYKSGDAKQDPVLAKATAYTCRRAAGSAITFRRWQECCSACAV
jgi:protein involved in polysaccharide export with SLBB domain